MEARAINRYIPTSPRKMRLVIDLIRGKSATEALHQLHFSPKHASKVAEKVLRSAIANLQNKDEAGRIEPEEITVKEAYVDAGMAMKRISPAPMGRAYRIRKRSNHVTIVVAAPDHVQKQAKGRPAAKAPKAETKVAKQSRRTKGSGTEQQNTGKTAGRKKTSAKATGGTAS